MRKNWWQIQLARFSFGNFFFWAGDWTRCSPEAFFPKQYFHNPMITSRTAEMQSLWFVGNSKHQSCDKMFWNSQDLLSKTKIFREALLVYLVLLLLFRIMNIPVNISNSQATGKMLSWSTTMNPTAHHSPFLYPERVGLLFHKAVLKKSHQLFLHKQ